MPAEVPSELSKIEQASREAYSRLKETLGEKENEAGYFLSALDAIDRVQIDMLHVQRGGPSVSAEQLDSIRERAMHTFVRRTRISDCFENDIPSNKESEITQASIAAWTARQRLVLYMLSKI